MGLRLAVAAAVLALHAGAAHAEDSPWSQGVSAETRAQAQQLLDEGNELFVRSKHLEALAKYQAAVALWDHPAIHFNMVRSLIALGRPLDAYASLERALRYGKGPFEDSTYTEALNYRVLLEGQIATLAVSCKQPGVTITVDGKPYVDCPGTKTERIAPGSHAIVGTKAGFMSWARDVVLPAGTTTPVDVTLQTISAATVTRTRWATWKPWAVAGAGALVTGIGVLVEMHARSQLDQYEADVSRACPTGCPAGDPRQSLLDNQEASALREDKIAVGVITVGALGVATGVVLAIVNRPRTYVLRERATVTPMLTSGGAGVSLVGRF